MNNHYHKHNNHLIHETSPYLLQHAHNPVNWHAWNKETLEKAQRENKPILVSIGYSACHWCHVMEHESFEDEEVAKMMNEHFICIKVDREERPDVDQVYMDAVQMLSGRGGWPLNCFTLPDGKPFWGATYFPKEQWIDVLNQISHLFKTQRADIENQANEIATGIERNDLLNITASKGNSSSRSNADEMVTRLNQRFDHKNGGTLGAPKFPMPNIYRFLLRYWFHTNDKGVMEQVNKTLSKMAEGGIYDQISGGFARYSVDDHWHVPHFEKMLYDNAQLVSLYAEAFTATKKPLYREVIEETLEFIKHELTSPEGGFYSALDADSDGEEGKFYMWTKKEFDEIFGKDSELLSAHFGIEKEALWEKGKNVLVKAASIENLAELFNLRREEVKAKIDSGKQKLFQFRSMRTPPGLDDKILTSWNALMLSGYVDAYKALGKKQFLDAALRNARFLKDNLIQNEGLIYRNYKNGKATIPGFLDDYAFTIEAFIALYEVTFDEQWINLAYTSADYVLQHFHDEKSGLFFYTSDRHTDVITRKMEVMDNVIPASTSGLAKCLFLLGLIYEKREYSKIANRMLAAVQEKMLRFPSAFTNWGIQLLHSVYPFHTFVVTGPGAGQKHRELSGKFHPHILLAGSSKKSELPILSNRVEEEKTQIFVCSGTECSLPMEKIDEALKIT